MIVLEEIFDNGISYPMPHKIPIALSVIVLSDCSHLFTLLKGIYPIPSSWHVCRSRRSRYVML